MIIKPFYTLIDHREFKYLKEEIEKSKEDHTIGSLSSSVDPFYKLDAIRIVNKFNKNGECYLTRWGVAYIICENDSEEKSLKKAFLTEIVKGIKTPGEALYEGFIKSLDQTDKKEKGRLDLESALYGISFPLLNKKDIDGKYEIKSIWNVLKIEYSCGNNNNDKCGNNNDDKCGNNNDDKWEASLSNNTVINTNGNKDLLKSLCIQHHLYTTLKTAVLYHVEDTTKSWDDIKRYVDVRTAQYREGVSIIRGRLDKFSLLNKLFANVWNMDICDKPKIKEFKKKGNNLESKKFNREDLHTEIYQHTNLMGETHNEIDNFVTDNINLKLTDDMRSAQLALRILQPLFMIGVVLSFITIIFRVMGIDIFENISSRIFVVGTPARVVELIIIVMVTMVSMFWITLNIITYARAFEQTIGATRSRLDIIKDLFFYIGSIGIIFIVIGLLMNSFESSPIIETLSIIMASIIIMLFFVFFTLVRIISSTEKNKKDNASEWAGIGTAMLLSFLSVAFLFNICEEVRNLSFAYHFLLWFILFMLWLFFISYAGKIGRFIFATDEVKPWKEFRKEIRKKFADKINNYICSTDANDPYATWNYGKIFITFRQEFLKKYITRETTLLLTYAAILLQTLAVTFNIGFILDKTSFSILFISGVASLLTTFIKVDRHLKDNEESIYALIAIVASIAADIHFIFAIMFYLYDPSFSWSLAIGAFIANVVALGAIVIGSMKGKEKEIKFEI